MQKTSTKTLYHYWNELRGARSAPDRRDIDPALIKGALANTFILERDASKGLSFRLAGSHVCSAYARELKGHSFTRLWHARDRDAMATLVRAVTEDHAVALVTFQGTTPINTRASFETILLPIRHNGTTDARLLGAMTALDTPYWLGTQPISEQRITGLRLIWPDELSSADLASQLTGEFANDLEQVEVEAVPTAMRVQPISGRAFGRSARRYAHLAVIDGGRRG